MTHGPWTFNRTAELQAAIDDLDNDPVLQRTVERDIEKLTTRGIDGARAPKFCKFQGDVYYIRSEAGRSMFRVYYFQSGPKSFCGFYGFKKSEQKMKPSEIKLILDRFELLKQKGGGT
jgi:phage-related protein